MSERGETRLGGEREKNQDSISFSPYSTSQIQQTKDDKDGLLSAKRASASQQTISTALLSASKYKSGSKEQHTKEEGIAKMDWAHRITGPND